MSTKSNLIRVLALSLMASFATVSAQAEISQREQQQAAQKAFEEAAKTHDEVTAGWQAGHDVATTVKDVAETVLEILSPFN